VRSLAAHSCSSGLSLQPVCRLAAVAPAADSSHKAGCCKGTAAAERQWCTAQQQKLQLRDLIAARLQAGSGYASQR